MTKQYESKVKVTNGHAVYRANGLYKVYTPPSGKYFTILDGLIWLVMIVAVITIVSVLHDQLDVFMAYVNQFLSLLG